MVNIYVNAMLQFWYETVDHTDIDYGPALLEMISASEEQRQIDVEFYLQLGASQMAGRDVLHLGRDTPSQDTVFHRVQQVPQRTVLTHLDHCTHHFIEFSLLPSST